MIYNTIKFDAAPFSYSLEFADRITLVRGDSATGKTYLYQMLEDLRLLEEYQAIIDNADLLLDNEDRRFINFDSSNQYMLFARNCDGLNLSSGSFMLLHENDYKVSLERELV